MLRPPEVSSRVNWIDACRAGAVLLVVFFHVCIWLHHPRWGGASEAAQVWQRLAAQIGAFRMPILVTVSGLLAARRIRAGLRAAAPSLVSNLYLYAVWVTIYALLAGMTPRPWRHDISSWRDYVAEGVRPTTTLWYVFALVVYIGLLLLLRQVPTVVVLTGLAALSMLVPYLGLPGMWPKISALAFFFALGVRGGGLLMGLASWWDTNRRWALASVSFLGGLFVLSLFLERLRSDQPWVGIALADARGVLAVLGCVGAAVLVTGTRIGARAAQGLGRRTLAIYVLHVVVIEAMISLAVLVPVEVLPAIWAWSAPLLITVGVVVLCLLGERLLLATPLRAVLRTPSRLVELSARGRRSNDSAERPRDSSGAATF